MLKQSLLIAVASCILFSANAQTSPLSISTSEYIEYSPTISPDGKTLIFQSNRDGAFGLYESTLQTDGSWSVPKAIEDLNKWSRPQRLIGGPCFNADGSELYLCALTSSSIGEMDIYVSKRKKGTWETPDNLGSTVNTINSESFPSISADGKKLYFTRTMVGDTSKCSRIMVSEKDASGKWQTAVEAPSILGQNCNKAPRSIYSDMNYFLMSGKNDGNFDLFQLKKNGEQYGDPRSLTFANSTGNDLLASISKREDYLVYASNGDIFYSIIPNDFRIHGKVWEGQTIDRDNKKAVVSKLWVIDTLAKDTLYRYSTDANGKFKINLPAYPGLKVLAKAEKYYPYMESFAIPLESGFEALNRKLELRPYKREVVFRVADADNNKGLKVKIKVTNTATGEEENIEANAGRDGQYAINLREGNRYNIEISSIEGYAFSNQIIDLPFTSESLIADNSTRSGSDTIRKTNAPSEIDIKLQPLKDNTKLELKDIYFEFNSFSLSDSSSAELNRVVKLMIANKSAKVEIAAHTDDVGSDEYNHKLSQKRAQEIVKYLVSNGIASSRLVPKGYGKTKPRVADVSEEARAKNRRVELKILDIK